MIKMDWLVGKNIDQGKSFAGNAEKTGLEHQSFFNWENQQIIKKEL